jgi:hypothetical protein
MYDVPGRVGNPYKDSLGSTVSGISETPSNVPVVNAICRTQPAAEDFGCSNSAGLNVKDLIPPRRIQYDIAVENQLYPKKKFEFPLFILLIVLLVVWYLSQ